MKKVYMVCDGYNRITGFYAGRILNEDGSEIGCHYSTSLEFLRGDLKRKLDKPQEYEIIDLIELPIPKKFQLLTRSN